MCKGKHIFSGAQGRDSTEKLIPREFLEYASKLSALPKNILHCELMKEFFKADKPVEIAEPSSGLGGTEGSSAKVPSTIHQQRRYPYHLPLPTEGQSPSEYGSSNTPHHHHYHHQQQQPPHPVSPLPQPTHPLTASLQHLDISHHQNINLTPPNPVHISAQPTVNQHSSSTAQLPTGASGSSSSSGSSTPPNSSGSNSVYFQTISSAISIPTPTELYNATTSSSENILMSRQPYDAAMLGKTQGLSPISPVNYATALPNSSDAFSPKLNPTEVNSPPANGEVPPVLSAPMVYLPHPHQPQHMVCFTTANSQPLNPTALPKNAVAPEIQEWLKKQRLHKYEYLFRGLSVSEVIELKDEDIDKWEIVTTGAKRRFKDHIEQLRQSLQSPPNGLTTPSAGDQSQFTVPHPHLPLMHQSPVNYFVVPGMAPGMMAPQYPGHCQEGSSDNSSSASASRESSDECDRDSEENDSIGFVSQDVRAHCNPQPNLNQGSRHGARQHQSKSHHGCHKSTSSIPGPASPLPYSQVVKSPMSPNEGGKNDPRHGSRGVRRVETPPGKGIVAPSDGVLHIGQHPTTIIHSTNSPVPPSPHQFYISSRGETPSAMDLEVSPGPNRTSKGPGNQKVSQPGVARVQLSQALPVRGGPTNSGWYVSAGNNTLPGVGPSNVTGLPSSGPTPLIAPSQQNLTAMTNTVQGAQMDHYNQTPSQRMEGPQQTPMVKPHGGRQAGNNNHFSGEEGIGYRTVMLGPGIPMQVNVPSESLQGQVTPEGNFVGSSPGQTQPNPKVAAVYTNTANPQRRLCTFQSRR
ncbi:putative zinc finger CCHC domain-containing protein 14 [Apostichopus japonicus]|uniref:Putative zinc finger CCHC domain-containing protein 14 n=1 Tax=Stichopus japonicus TaxID=307972 RepID=A0A2G8JHT7_STIJA|nr:putative zinc finger CCHC domain-containing protein 14 [Apostichopus japonicus]